MVWIMVTENMSLARCEVLMYWELEPLEAIESSTKTDYKRVGYETNLKGDRGSGIVFHVIIMSFPFLQ